MVRNMADYSSCAYNYVNEINLVPRSPVQHLLLAVCTAMQGTRETRLWYTQSHNQHAYWMDQGHIYKHG